MKLQTLQKSRKDKLDDSGLSLVLLIASPYLIAFAVAGMIKLLIVAVTRF